MGVYLDTSAIAKLYHPEVGASVVEQIVNESPRGLLYRPAWGT